MYLIIEIPDTYHQEREYIISLLMHDFLGLKYEIIYMNRKNIRITKGNDSCQKEILLPDILFQTPESLWLTHESLPVLPLHEWNTRDLSLDFPLISFDVPIIYGDHLNFARSMKSISLPIDIFG
ncbi:MAG: MarR family transcriptional regulator, partial [Bacillota bacterium]|nr:MarR family transcriptional regulator [Bacillota bacterium]